jgi:hypothetical protein
MCLSVSGLAFGWLRCLSWGCYSCFEVGWLGIVRLGCVYV